MNQCFFAATSPKFKVDKAGRKAIRTNALNEISRDLTSLDCEERTRAVSICSAMPLFYKHRSSFTLFSKTDTHKKLEALLDEQNVAQLIK